MSQENIELVRKLFEAVNRLDDQAALAICHPDFEIDWTRSRGPERGMYRGHDGYRRLTTTYREVFDKITYEPEEYIESGDDVVVPHVATLRHRDGIETTARAVFVYTVEDGQVVRFRMFQSRDEALAAVRG